MRFRTASGKYFDEDNNPYSIGLRKALAASEAEILRKTFEGEIFESRWNEIFGRKQMSVKGRFCIDNPESVEMTLELKMTLGDWRRLLNQIDSSKFPSWKIISLISEMVKKAETEFRAEGPSNDG